MKSFRLVLFSLATLAGTVIGCSKQAEVPRGSTPTGGVESKQGEATIHAPASVGRVTSAFMTLGATNMSNGMTLVNEAGDGATQFANLEGVPVG